jgi:hypothetical protein
MTSPGTPVNPSAPSAPPVAATHPCARCGAPVAVDRGLCETCNPLGLKDSASSQVHGTVFLGIGAAVAALAIIAHLAVAGIGPFSASVTAMRPASATGSFLATVQVRNDGSTVGSANCRLSDPGDPSVLHSTLLYTPRIEPGQTMTFEQEVGYGAADRLLAVTCTGP